MFEISRKELEYHLKDCLRLGALSVRPVDVFGKDGEVIKTLFVAVIQTGSKPGKFSDKIVQIWKAGPGSLLQQETLITTGQRQRLEIEAAKVNQKGKLIVEYTATVYDTVSVSSLA